MLMARRVVSKNERQWCFPRQNISFSLKDWNLDRFDFIADKNLIVSISGDVDEAKALSKPPEDSQGTKAHI